MRPPLRTGLLVVAGLAIGGLVTSAVPAGPALASGQVCEGVVVDEGTGAAPAPQTAEVAPGASDLDALDAAGDTATQNSSGLVCAINAYPPNGLQACLNTAGSLYYYWSYWEGDPATNTWTYAPVGPAEHTVSAGQTYVEGWRYQDPGPDGPSATKPSVTPAAAFAQACPGVTPVSSVGWRWRWGRWQRGRQRWRWCAGRNRHHHVGPDDDLDGAVRVGSRRRGAGARVGVRSARAHLCRAEPLRDGARIRARRRGERLDVHHDDHRLRATPPSSTRRAGGQARPGERGGARRLGG